MTSKSTANNNANSLEKILPSPLVSVIVPVYNTSQYLSDCLNSLINQTLEAIEIICVDDGSTDNSLDILKEFARRDSRIKIQTQKNQFAGVARNNGFHNASGEYVLFCDSDDYIKRTTLEKMYTKSKQDDADICVCGGRRYFERIGLEADAPNDLRPSRLPSKLPFNRKTNAEHIFNFSTIMAYNKLYRSSFLREHNLCYGTTRNGEDVFFSAMALWYANNITVVNEGLVVYRVGRPDSLVRTLSESALDPLEAWVQVWRAIGHFPDFPKQSFDNKVIGVIRHTFKNITSEKAARSCFDYLRNGILDELKLTVQEDGYYANWINEFIAHLRKDTFDDFLLYMLYSTSRSLEEESARKRLSREKLKQLKKTTKEQKQELANLRKNTIHINPTLKKNLGWIRHPFRR